MPLSELGNDSESLLAKYLQIKFPLCSKMERWNRQPDGSSEEFQLFRDQPDDIRTKHKGN